MCPEQVVHVRRNVWTLPDDDLTLAHYAAAVNEMKGRDPDDPTSWTYQAAIHYTGQSPALPLWKNCKHGSWFFLAWHRMYLWYFERIVRAAVVDLDGPADWALPFWDYGADRDQARIPPTFRDEEGGANPLFAKRFRGINQGVPLPVQMTSAAAALGRSQFVGEAEFGGGITPDVASFWNRSGLVERTPHNDVHSHIGGWMGDPATAALDPIFWLHHANIDRLWFQWASRPGNGNPTDPRWTSQEYDFFDADGSRKSLAASDIVDIAGRLGYTYESPALVTPPPAPPAPPPSPAPEVSMSSPNGPEPLRPKRREMAGSSEETVHLVGRAASVTVPIDQRTTRSLGRALGVPVPEADRRVYLNVEDIEGDRNPNTVYGIYVNLPADASDDLAENHRVGNLSFFGIERAQDPRGDEHPHGLRVTVEITPLVLRLEAEDAWDDSELRVTFLPLGPVDPEAEDPPIEIGRVSLGYT
ncbi:tyrosinase family protein [Streptomyces sp. NPDC054932]